MPEYDQIAHHYDETRGGEQRGDEYAATVDTQLPVGEGPVLEIGVGTGVVALGLARRGRMVIGVDVSASMLSRAWTRLGPRVIRGDALLLPVGTARVAHAVSVWVVHAVPNPVMLFQEAARVIRPGGHYVVCTTQRPAFDDGVGQIVEAMAAEVEARAGACRSHETTGGRVLDLARGAGFTGTTVEIERHWTSSPAQEVAAITGRTWPALRDLDEAALAEVTRPAIEALQSMPAEPCLRRATADMVVLQRG